MAVKERDKRRTLRVGESQRRRQIDTRPFGSGRETGERGSLSSARVDRAEKLSPSGKFDAAAIQVVSESHIPQAVCCYFLEMASGQRSLAPWSSMESHRSSRRASAMQWANRYVHPASKIVPRRDLSMTLLGGTPPGFALSTKWQCCQWAAMRPESRPTAGRRQPVGERLSSTRRRRPAVGSHCSS